MADRDDFDTFVAARSTALLRIAFLLTHDRGLAEDLVQTALAKAWFAWGRIEGSPDTYVRRILVNTYASWWRRKWNGEQATEQLPESAQGQSSAAAARHAASGQVDDRTDLWQALGRLPQK
ncbi:MAG: sigma factor [Terracoccus sp.]